MSELRMKSVRKRLESLKPAPENDDIYKVRDMDNPAIIELAESIQKHGLKQKIVISKDNFILSGHRRTLALKRLGRKWVTCDIENISRERDPEKFVQLLVEYNRHRDKTLDEKLHEEIINTDPAEAHRRLVTHRLERSGLCVDGLRLEGYKHRKQISEAKEPMLDAIRRIIFEDRREFWPMSVRAVHYALLNYKVLRHAKKRGFFYVNDRDSYQDLSDLLTRARLEGIIPWAAIGDETRPFTRWEVWQDPRAFMRKQLDDFMRGYYRDYLQSQSNHFELIVEKNTVYPVVKSVAAKYCLPVMSGRGFASITPYRDMAMRFRKSGKQKLVIPIISDWDPEGLEIRQVAGRTLRDDFGIPSRNLEIIEVAITPAQITSYEMPENNEAKQSSSRYKKFVERHGTSVYELEALQPEQLQDELREVLDQIIDVEALNQELDEEKKDAAYLEGVRNTVLETLKTLNFGEE